MGKFKQVEDKLNGGFGLVQVAGTVSLTTVEALALISIISDGDISTGLSINSQHNLLAQLGRIANSVDSTSPIVFRS
jgi:hypothetical protein